MKISIKNYLIQEGVLQGVKDHWGKGLMAAGGLAAANAGVFGDKAEEAVKAGGTRAKEFMDKAGDWSKNSMDKLKNTYGEDTDGDGSKELGKYDDDGMLKNDVSLDMKKMNSFEHNPIEDIVVDDGPESITGTHDTIENVMSIFDK